MNAVDYHRAVAIAHRACRGRPLSRQDWEEVEQDAAVEAWRTGSVTRIWWAAADGARRIQRIRRVSRPDLVPLTWDLCSEADVEAEVVDRLTVEELLGRLPEREREAVEAMVLGGRTGAELAAAWNVADSTISRRRTAALSRLRT
jgi:DNA-directed RNA polymerase specialized sigma24 family protein